MMHGIASPSPRSSGVIGMAGGAGQGRRSRFGTRYGHGMRGWFGVLAMIVAASVSAHAAEGGARASTRPGPALARGGVPLPRPKPADASWLPTAAAASQPARQLHVEGALSTDASGELDVSVDRMKRERDPYVSADLQPAEVTSWSKEDVQQAQQQCAMV